MNVKRTLGSSLLLAVAFAPMAPLAHAAPGDEAVTDAGPVKEVTLTDNADGSGSITETPVTPAPAAGESQTTVAGTNPPSEELKAELTPAIPQVDAYGVALLPQNTSYIAYTAEGEGAMREFRATSVTGKKLSSDDDRVWTLFETDESDPLSRTFTMDAPAVITVIPNAVITDLPGSDRDSVVVAPAAGRYTVKTTNDGIFFDVTLQAADGVVFDSSIAGWTISEGGKTATRKYQATARTTVSMPTPIVKNNPGTANDSVTFPATPGVTFEKVVINPTTGTWVARAVAAQGYVLGNQNGWVPDFNGNTAELRGVIGQDTVALPAPTIKDGPGTANDSVTFPKTTGVTIAPVVINHSAGSWTTTATAEAGYTLTAQHGWVVSADGSTATISGVMKQDSIILPMPVITDEPGLANDVVTLPKAPTGATFSEVTYNKETGEYTATATAADGYTLVANTGWQVSRDGKSATLTGSTTNNQVTVALPEVTVVDKDGTANDVVTFPKAPLGVEFKDAKHDKTSGVWTITAAPQEGYIIDIEASEGWMLLEDGVTAVAEGVTTNMKLVTPEQPIVTDNPGVEADEVKVPTTEGVDYALEYDRAKGTWRLVATPQENYYFAENVYEVVYKGQLDTTPAPQEQTPTDKTPTNIPSLNGTGGNGVRPTSNWDWSQGQTGTNTDYPTGVVNDNYSDTTDNFDSTVDTENAKSTRDTAEEEGGRVDSGSMDGGAEGLALGSAMAGLGALALGLRRRLQK